MSTSIARTPRRVLAGLLAVALALAGVVLSATTAGAQAETDRVAGENRYGTAADIATATFPDGADDVILATGLNYPDALAASGLGGTVSAPVLLTAPDALPQETTEALETLDPTTVHIVGGTAVVSQDVEDALDDAGYETPRYGGENRYETAQLIAAQIGADNVADDTAIIATGQNFPDALAGGPLAYSGPHPILLVTEDSVPEPTAEALTDLGISQVLVLGGPDAINDDVVDEVEQITGDDEAQRLAGDTRYDTANEIADYLVDNVDGFSLSTVLLANGVENLGVDALAGGPHGGVIGAPILLTTEETLSPETEAYLQANAGSVDTIRALGGVDVIDDETLAAAAAAADIEPQTYDVALSWINEFREETLTFRNGEVGATGSATVTLDPDTDTVEYQVDYSEVTGPFDGAPGFHIHEGGIADEGPIVVTLATGAELAADPDQVLIGTVTTDDVENLGDVINDIIGSPENYYLNLHSDDFPAGAIRGQLPDGGQAEVPETDTGTVTASDTGADTYSFVVEDASEVRTVTYDGDDQFTVDGANATIGAFEDALSVGDTVAFSGGDDADDTVNLHALTNATVTSGTVGNVDTSADTFDIISPTAGVVLNQGLDYGADALFALDGAAVTQSTFEANINEGDTITTSTEGGVTTYALTNTAVEGEVTDLDQAVADTTAFQIDGVLGDVPTTAVNDVYVAAAADDATEEYIVDGESVDYATFAAAITADDPATADVNEADTIAYSREGGVETFDLTEAVLPVPQPDEPQTFEGEATADDLTDDAFTLATATGPEAIDYSVGSTEFAIGGAVATEAEFETAYSAGDNITVTEGFENIDADAEEEIVVAQIALTNDTLEGGVGTVDVAADTYQVLGPDDTTSLDTVNYTTAGDDRYFVDGSEVNLDAFETALGAADANDTIELVDTALATEHRLTTN